MDNKELMNLISEYERLKENQNSESNGYDQLPDFLKECVDRVIGEGAIKPDENNIIHVDFIPKTIFSYPLQKTGSDKTQPWYLLEPLVELKDNESVITFLFSADAHSDSITVEVSVKGKPEDGIDRIRELRQYERFGLYSGDKLLASFEVEDDDYELGLFAEGKVHEKFATIGKLLDICSMPKR